MVEVNSFGIMVEVNSFVVGAIVAAILVAGRLGGQEEVARRLYQVALGFALAFTVSSATTAFLRADTLSAAQLSRLSEAQVFQQLLGGDNANLGRDSASIRAGAGAILLLVGFATMARWSTLSLGLAFGGLLLLLVGGPSGGVDVNALSSNAIFGALFGRAEQGSDIAHFIVLVLGAAALLFFGYWRWERKNAAANAAA